MWKRKKQKTIEDMTVEDLLEEFNDLEANGIINHVTVVDDDVFVQRRLRIEARRTLEKLKKTSPDSKDEDSVDLPPIKKKPVMSQATSVIKRCQNCYFCVNSHTLGSSVWCYCANPSRSSGEDISKSWIRSRMNLPCWRPAPE